VLLLASIDPDDRLRDLPCQIAADVSLLQVEFECDLP
jgi:hypothetical protein